MPRLVITTVLIGPSVLLREGLTKVLRNAGIRNVISAADIPSLADGTVPQSEPVLLIIDAGDNLGLIIEQLGNFKQRYPLSRVAVLADNCAPPDMLRAFRAGANAYLAKNAPLEALTRELELVVLGETILPASMLPAILDGRREEEVRAAPEPIRAAAMPTETQGDTTPALSCREKYVLNCLLKGDVNKTIARKLGITEATVKVHVKAILRKIRVQNRTQAAIWAMNNGLFPAETEADPIGPVAAKNARPEHDLPALNGEHFARTV
jgi:DNA-binding NarL/FixJ family response regulator